MRNESVGAIGQLSTPMAITPVAAAIAATFSPAADGGLAEVQGLPGSPANEMLSLIDTGRAIDPSIVQQRNGPAATAPVPRSVNRFAAFESGVLFWFRGATAASVLTPLTATSDGTSLAFSGADIAAIAIARLGRASVEFANAQLLSSSFIGTTGYSYDGAQVHNRRHRLQLILQGMEIGTVRGPFGMLIPQLGVVTAAIELQVEVWFDAMHRRIVLALVDWSLAYASSGSYGAMVESGLRSRLDPLLWLTYEIMTLPDTDGGAPIAVLSIKTFANGAVVVFCEPRRLQLLDGIGDLANASATTVIHFAPPV